MRLPLLQLLLLSVVESGPTAHVPLSARALVDDRGGDAILGQHACAMKTQRSGWGRPPCAHQGYRDP